MSTPSKLQKLIKNGFSDKESLIKQRDVEDLLMNLQKLDVLTESKGYTIPLLDTIGMNLQGKFSCQIKDT